MKPATYTREVIAEGGAHTLNLFVEPDTDFDSRFTAWDANEGELIHINGWLFAFEDHAHALTR